MNPDKSKDRVNHHFARVAFIGEPNAGKSTLLNALLDTPFSATSKRPQTTRTLVTAILQNDQIQAIYNNPDWSGQLVLLDTPGLNMEKGLLDRHMFQSIEQALTECELAVWVADSTKFTKTLDSIDKNKVGDWMKDRFTNENGTNWILVLTKADLMSRNNLLPIIQRAHEKFPGFKGIIPVCSKHGIKDPGSNLNQLIKVAQSLAPIGEALYSPDEWTSLNNSQFIQNLIRETIFRLFYQEVPYASDCTIEKYLVPNGKKRKRLEVDAAIWVAKDSIKSILIGKNGQKIKEIGITIRERYKEVTGDDLILRLFVKVVEDWDRRPHYLEELGYGTK